MELEDLGGFLSLFFRVFFGMVFVLLLYNLVSIRGFFLLARVFASLKVLYVEFCECMVEITYRFFDGEWASD